MKKFTALALAAVMAFTLAACGNSSGTSGNEDSVPVLTVAISPDFAPMEFVDTSKTGQEQYVGFDVTLSKFIADELGMTLDIKPMSFDACQAAVQAGKVDMSVSGYSYTDDRAKNFELSDYYYAGDNETKQVTIVLAENEGKWTKAEDYDGLVVAVQAASLQLQMAEDQLTGAEIKQFTDIGTEVEALRNGNVDAVAVAEGNGKAIIAGNDNIVMSGFEFEVDESEENNVILIQKGNTELLEKVNAALAKAYEAGYYGQWYIEAQELAGIDTAADVSYDEEGNVVED